MRLELHYPGRHDGRLPTASLADDDDVLVFIEIWFEYLVVLHEFF